jgi:hypothetical protein
MLGVDEAMTAASDRPTRQDNLALPTSRLTAAVIAARAVLREMLTVEPDDGRLTAGHREPAWLAWYGVCQRLLTARNDYATALRRARLRGGSTELLLARSLLEVTDTVASDLRRAMRTAGLEFEAPPQSTDDMLAAMQRFVRWGR